MNEIDAALRHLLSCSLCGTYYGYSDLVVACEQACAAALEQALATLCAENPGLWADRCSSCGAQLAWEHIVGHRRSWSLKRAVEVPAPLCGRCLQPAHALNGESSADSDRGPMAEAMQAETHEELTALVADVEHRDPGGDAQ
jgi:hypothetical protein